MYLLVEQPFVQLPLLTPEQIRLARKIQQFFTGDLEAPVRCDFNYPGMEKHLLRAQIQRISAGTQVDNLRVIFHRIFFLRRLHREIHSKIQFITKNK